MLLATALDVQRWAKDAPASANGIHLGDEKQASKQAGMFTLAVDRQLEGWSEIVEAFQVLEFTSPTIDTRLLQKLTALLTWMLTGSIVTQC